MFQVLSLFAHHPVVDLCVSSYLLQEEASLMMAEQVIEPRMQQDFVESFYFTKFL